MDKPSINKDTGYISQNLQISEEDITTALPKLNREIFFFIISSAWEKNWIPDQWRYSVVTIIYQKLLHHMDKIEKLEPTQFGFRKNLDIAQAITSLILTLLSRLFQGL